VSMYSEYLKEMLRPLGIYNVDGGYGAAELEVLGEQMDRLFQGLEAVERETILVTAQGQGLENYEKILPYPPVSPNLEDRRSAIAALMRIDGCSFTLEALRDTLRGCGIPADVCEGGKPATVLVSFPGIRGIPEGIDELKTRIEMILPCHLQVEYFYVYILWQELESRLESWQAIEALDLNWRDMEKYE
jgi:hypothetical protein